jgi:hypothetical protein
MNSDPYTNTLHCASRLVREWQKHPKLIIAVDADDTVLPYHLNGDTHERVWEILKVCYHKGFYIVGFTASIPSRYSMIEQLFIEKGISLSGINKNPIELPFGNWGKIYYNILLDDRAGLGQALDTLEIALTLIEQQEFQNTTTL